MKFILFFTSLILLCGCMSSAPSIHTDLLGECVAELSTDGDFHELSITVEVFENANTAASTSSTTGLTSIHFPILRFARDAKSASISVGDSQASINRVAGGGFLLAVLARSAPYSHYAGTAELAAETDKIRFPLAHEQKK